MPNKMAGGRGGLRWRLLPVIRVAFALLGRRWVDFYAWMLDRQETKNSIGDILHAGRGVPGKDRGLYDLSRSHYHLVYLRRHGLLPSHKLFDFGCGFGRTAIVALPFLDPGNYVGAEISRERIRIAKEWIEREKLGDRRPRFEVTRDLDLGYLDTASIDIFWMQAVVSHMPRSDIERVFAAARRVLRAEGILLFDYVEAQDGYERHTIKDFFYTRDQMEQMVSRAGFRFERLTDWNDDLPPEERNPAAIVIKARP
jgi:SAM-dependent methyltransferase